MSLLQTVLTLGALIGLVLAVLIDKRRQRDEDLIWRMTLRRLMSEEMLDPGLS